MLWGLDRRAFRQLVLLCTSHFLFSCSFNMPIPELPAYLSSLGGERYIGLIISLFTLMAGLSRPFSGKLADTVGRVPVMIYGSLICVVCSLLYPVLGSVAGFLWLRFFHGFSTGFKPTGASAYVADIIPLSRRGQAMGVLGLCSTLGLSLGPALGSAVAQRYGLTFMFFTSAVAALLSVLILAGMKESLAQRQPFRWRLLRISRREIFEPRVTAPALVTFLLYASYGAALTLIPDMSLRSGLHNKGVFFTFFTLGSVGVRLLAGRVPDRFGRVPVLKLAGVIMAGSMLLIALRPGAGLLLAAAVVYGLAMGMLSPAASAWTVDLARPGGRGRALATMFIAMEAGIGLGALASGWWYNLSGGSGLLTFSGMALLALLAVG